MPERHDENPQERAVWRKKILEKMFKGLKRPLYKEKTWEMLRDSRSGEFSFMVGNTILFLDENGNPLSVKILENGRVRPSTQIVKMTTLMDHALNHYAMEHRIDFSGGETENEEETSGLTVDIDPENAQPEGEIIKKIRKKLKL